MPNLFNKVGQGLKNRWQERQDDKARKAEIDERIKTKRKDLYYATYEKQKTELVESQAKRDASRSAQGRKLSSLNVNMGTLQKGAGRATAGLDFLSKDIFGGSGSTDIFGTSSKKSTKGAGGKGNRVTVRAGGTTISVRTAGPEGEEKKQRSKSISDNIEDLLDLGNLSPTDGLNTVRNKRLEDLVDF